MKPTIFRAGYLRARGRRRLKLRKSAFQPLETRSLLSVTVLNNSGQGYAGLSFNQSGGYVPPDTNGAAGPSAYVETVNQSVMLFGAKATGGSAVSDSLSHFFFTTGGLTRADSSSGQSDPVAAYDDQIGRFVIGDQDVDFTNHISAFDLAVSKTSTPSTLSASDWAFYKINTTETGYDADYPGNFGYNHDALVVALNMFGVTGGGHVQILAVNASDLANASSSPQVVKNDLNDFSVRPTTMHDSVAGDPMWFVTEHGDNQSIDVIKMSGELTTSPSFVYTNLPVNPYSTVANPLNPNGTVVTNNIDSRIMKAAEYGQTIVATHAVGISASQDAAQWYAINVGSGTPTLSQQGRVGAGLNTYVTYPGIDINSSGQIGMSYIRSGTDSSTDFLSMWVTGRNATDAAGTMESSVEVPAGTGQANYADWTSGGRAGDLSGINIDPVDGSFWAANEFANTQSTANWGTAIAQFAPSALVASADMAVTASGPSQVTAGTNATYTVTITNNGASAAAGVALSDTLPAGAVFVSMTQTAGSDAFTLSQSNGTVSESAAANIASGSSDTFSLVVSAPSTLAAGSNFSDTASVSSTTSDPNTANNSASVSGTVVSPVSADVAVAETGPSSAVESGNVTYTTTVTNTDAVNSATGIVVTDTLSSNLGYPSATTTAGSFTQSNGVVTFSVGTLAPGASATLTVTAQTKEDGTARSSVSESATTADPNTANNTAAAATSVSEAAIVVSAPITLTKSLSNVKVATFTHGSGIEPTSAFAATINWGDGTTSSGKITESGGIYSVTGSHKYKRTGSYTVSTTVTETGSSAQLLFTKMGDEKPALPDHIGPLQRPLNDGSPWSDDPAAEPSATLAKSAPRSSPSPSAARENAIARVFSMWE